MSEAGDSPGSPPVGQQFRPTENCSVPSDLSFPDSQWRSVLESACTFPSEIFTEVMLNMIKNPNVTSSHLFRADIFYDSDSDRVPESCNSNGKMNHLKPEYRPWSASWPGFDAERRVVRQLVPRNPQVDTPLVQTCYFFSKQSGDTGCEYRLVLYVPHVHGEEYVPFYHPRVSQLAFLHVFRPCSNTANTSSETGNGTLTLLYRYFPTVEPSSMPKLQRTALRLLQTAHKHGQGQFAGYQKRVHLDRMVPQRRYQDTYTRLKTTYARDLVESWVEVTDPSKHVFEDLAIAAFLIELWRDMYRLPMSIAISTSPSVDTQNSRLAFPGFVDIGCGNGLLVYVLLQEGYHGFGVDARERKTWSTFPGHVRRNLQRKIVVPSIFSSKTTSTDNSVGGVFHSGIFEPGTFIISNHADELTAWTPLLAYLNDSYFIAIPCCSHDLAGARSRLPATRRMNDHDSNEVSRDCPSDDVRRDERRTAQAAETGSLQRSIAQKKMASAYSTLCSYVASLAEDVGFDPESETLRIPSTRNHCVVGRKLRSTLPTDDDEKARVICNVVERELKKSVEVVAAEWTDRVEKLAQKPGSGH